MPGKVRTGRDGSVYDGRTYLGKVARSAGSWTAHVQVPGRLVMRYVGTFALKRDAVSEVIIMREA